MGYGHTYIVYSSSYYVVDMQRGEESAEEVVEGNLEGIQPLFAIIQFEC